MSKQKKQLTVQELQVAFESLQLTEQLQHFKACKIVLDDKKKQMTKALEDLTRAEINSEKEA